MSNLPTEFQTRMRALLGGEAEAFLASFHAPRCNGLRVNTKKVSPEAFVRLAPFALEPIPWTQNGFFVDYRTMPGQHPLYRAGLYYLQEPSAMAPAQLLCPRPGDRVLDLCAAPGGKATEIGARLCGKGLLVANEISKTRAKALLRNLEAFGILNAVVTNTTADRLAERFGGYFDRILVDAPCSGEGMFRKDADAAEAWTPDKPKRCAAIQRELVLQAADMLRPGGIMVYSTCTFAPEEDEWVLAYLLQERADMELVPITLDEGRETFSRSYSTEELIRRGFGQDEAVLPAEAQTQGRENEPGPEPGAPHIHTEYAVRIWPHRARGEGHFVALLRKRESAAHAENMTPLSQLLLRADAGEQLGGKELKPSDGRRESSRQKLRRSLTERQGGQSLTGRQAEQLFPYLKILTRQPERKLSGEGKSAAEKERPGSAPSVEDLAARLEVHAGQVFLDPESVPDLHGIPFLRCGLRLGELKKDRFEPGQELAVAADFSNRISFGAEDPNLYAFLRGESVRLEPAPSGEGKAPDRRNTLREGWIQVCAEGYPVGWGRLTGGLLKNRIPASWRVDLKRTLC